MTTQPCRPPAPQPRLRRATIGAVPDRAAMELFLQQVDVRHEVLLRKAQDVIYDAWAHNVGRIRIALARKALGITPLCADAYSLLGGETASTEEARTLYATAIEAAELALGSEWFEAPSGKFWGSIETRPYMRARVALMTTLWKLGHEAAAVAHCRALLTLNPTDNQGVRYALAALLLKQDELEQLHALLELYGNEASTIWLYTRALLVFRSGGGASPQAVDLAKQAWTINRHVPGILAGTREPVFRDADRITVGGPDEATDYARNFGAAWRGLPGAVAWLTKTAAALKRAQRAYAATR